jgi:3-oxoacyl-(acyl-carrier-protein) synthase
MVSPDGACKSFDASANGYARAEGVAAVVLKRAGLAGVPWAAPREPYARIVGCDTNNDGFTEKGITFPSGDAQSELGTKARAPATRTGTHASLCPWIAVECKHPANVTRESRRRGQRYSMQTHTWSPCTGRLLHMLSAANTSQAVPTMRTALLAAAAQGGCAQGRLPTS